MKKKLLEIERIERERERERGKCMYIYVCKREVRVSQCKRMRESERESEVCVLS